ncbi:TPA: restriction endonuclease subunit S [Streptococcus suis]
MTRMKDSGIEWIGEVPEEWGTGKIKYYAEISAGSTPDRTNELFWNGDIPWMASGEVNQGVVTHTAEKITKLGLRNTSTKLLSKGTVMLALNGQGKTKGTAAILNIETASNQSLASFDVNNEFVNGYFLYYYFVANYSNIRGLKGEDRDGLNLKLVSNIEIPLPSIDEQLKIADFLDKKVAQLDKVKSLLEEQIKTLEDYRQSLIYETVTKGLDKTVPLKDSGVDWIGQIPEGWGVSRLDMYVAIYGRIGFRGYTSSDIVEEGEGAISLSPSNIVEHKVVNYNNTYVSWDKYDESPEIQVQEGNILYVKTGSSYGKAGLVTSLSEKSTINPQLVIFKCRKYVEARYINYLLNCQLGKDQSELIVGGSTIPTISQEKLRKMQFPYISFDDQNQIANFLDKKTEQINQMIAIKKEQIDNINKQRQTLIYDYVTGKRRV